MATHAQKSSPTSIPSRGYSSVSPAATNERVSISASSFAAPSPTAALSRPAYRPPEKSGRGFSFSSALAFGRGRHRTLGGNGHDCSGGKRGAWAPDYGDGYRLRLNAGPETGVTVGETTPNTNMTHGRFLEPWVCQRRARSRSGPQRSERYPRRTYVSSELRKPGVTGGESAATISRTHRGPGAADFGGVKGMEGARLQSARAPRFAALAWRRPRKQNRFVRLLAGPHQSGAIIRGIWWSPSLSRPDASQWADGSCRGAG